MLTGERKPRIALALGSGGLKGVAHIGVLRALEEAEIRPGVFAGSSAGALVAAAAAHGIATSELEALADRARRKPLFQIDYWNLLRCGLRTPGLYRREPVHELCQELFGDVTFRQLRTPLLVSSVDVESAAPTWWSTDSVPEVRVTDAVYASCALPGLLPPGLVGGRLYMDGAVVDPLGLRAVAPLADAVIAVVLDDAAAAARGSRIAGAPGLWLHAQGIVARDLSRRILDHWAGPPLFVVRISLPGVPALRGSDPRRLIDAGYEAARRAIERWEGLALPIDDAPIF